MKRSFSAGRIGAFFIALGLCALLRTAVFFLDEALPPSAGPLGSLLQGKNPFGVTCAYFSDSL